MPGFLLQIAVSIALNLIASALMPRPPQPKPPGVEQLELPTAEEGSPLPVVFGRVLITQSNVLAGYDPSTTGVRTKAGK